jgi:hypothetical protein
MPFGTATNYFVDAGMGFWGHTDVFRALHTLMPFRQPRPSNHACRIPPRPTRGNRTPACGLAYRSHPPCAPHVRRSAGRATMSLVAGRRMPPRQRAKGAGVSPVPRPASPLSPAGALPEGDISRMERMGGHSAGLPNAIYHVWGPPPYARPRLCNRSESKTARARRILYSFRHKGLRAFGRDARTEFRHDSCNTVPG